jgi:hypothetical protein
MEESSATRSQLAHMEERWETAKALNRRADIIAAQVEGALRTPQPSRAELHSLLDVCLDLKDLYLSGRQADPLFPPYSAATHAHSIGTRLARTALRWMETGQAAEDDHWSPWWRELAEDPPKWRTEVCSRLSRAPTGLPEAMVSELIRALRDLDDGSGSPPPLLTPERAEGKGPNPRRARDYEEQLWVWIYWQKGAGRRIDDARADVARATGMSSQAVNAWRDAWYARDGREEVKRKLDEAVHDGRQGILPLFTDDMDQELKGLAVGWRRYRWGSAPQNHASK